MVPDQVRCRARELLQAASDDERPVLERFVAALGLLHVPEPRVIHQAPDPLPDPRAAP
jgi:hypothetical protein